MKLGENILKLRKKTELSQEQLGEQIGVTRQTISNWELSITEPNPRQLKLLSKSLNISIDELLENDIKIVDQKPISNTEYLAGIIIKILKAVGILLIALLVIAIITLILFSALRAEPEVSTSSTVELSCSLNNKDYLIEVEQMDILIVPIVI